MLDISFYSKDGQDVEAIEVTEDVYKRLAESGFSKISKSVKRNFNIDNDKVQIEVVRLSKGNRQKLKTLFLEEIAEESDRILSALGLSPSKLEIQDMTFRLSRLQELRKCVSDDRYEFIERV